MAENTANLTISRDQSNDLGIREIMVYLDDQFVARLRNKEQFSLALAPGEHVLRVDNTFAAKRLRFTVAAGEQLYFSTANRSGCATSLVFLLGAGPIYIALERSDTNP